MRSVGLPAIKPATQMPELWIATYCRLGRVRERYTEICGYSRRDLAHIDRTNVTVMGDARADRKEGRL
jgi:hypothetical protein